MFNKPIIDELEIIQEKIPEHLDSLWYDDVIAVRGKYRLIASGDIEIYNSKIGERVFARGKHYSDEFCPKDDSELSREYFEKNNLEWGHNNWFEVIGTEPDDYVLGDVAYDYDEAIALLNQYYNENVYGN